ncbi:MAG: phytoene desaturase family protein [Blastocatellia bacterium]
MEHPQTDIDTAIVGGGLAGLTAACLLARAGRRVHVCEKSHAVGGRAGTENKQGFHFNLGPHALYARGAGVEILREIGVKFSGGLVGASGAYAVAGGRKHALPSGLLSLLTTSLLPLPAKLELGRMMGAIHKVDPAQFRSISVAAWLEQHLRHPDARRFMQAFFRVCTYANDPARQSAGSALTQAQMSLRGSVWYLDSGWQTLVDSLRVRAESAGARIVTGARVDNITRAAGGFQLHHGDGSLITAATVILATSPADACAVFEGGQNTTLANWRDQAIPVHAACLDLALSRLPDQRAMFALGIDQPLYLSVHSHTARLAPDNGAVIHVAKYLPGEKANLEQAKATERELEQLVDLIQPGWRNLVIERRFLPRMTVTHKLTTAAESGAAGRPGPAVSDVPGLFVAGDWAGQEGQLADASFASARQAAELILDK